MDAVEALVGRGESVRVVNRSGLRERLVRHGRHHRSGLHGVDELPEAIRDVHAGRVRGKIVVAT